MMQMGSRSAEAEHQGELYEEGEDDDGLKISHLMSEGEYRDVWRRLDVVAHPEKEETRSNSGKSSKIV